ncbi:SRPBCC domain-containing protein [Anoxynatronum buryatiense]|uniref:SRPBCC domain-containing protein n=1 Tax=Anoxynatronum buryatiense TaxID=489973 RepID=A0AA45WZ42_9CLOT|nr:SRPBCC domain-containing protein [Anoxynatronum buryatiense]SMP72152.1 hypothetical protein SAMN06296020_1266 [Anoxynatronum buryatiense]
MKEIRTKIQIHAPVETVWNVLTDVERYPEWNPFIKSLHGNLDEDEIIQVELQLADKKPMIIRPKIVSVQEFQELRWKGRLLLPGIFDGEHIFELSESEDQTTCLIHREKFSGVMVPFLKKLLDVNTLKGFEMMNQSLKKRCEALRGE